MARKLQQEEEEDNVDGAEDEQLMLDQKLAMEAQDAELARMLQDKERAKIRKARERARQRKLERERLQQQQQQQQHQQQLEDPIVERPQRPDRLDLRTPPIKSRSRHPVNYSPQYPDREEIQTLDNPGESAREMANVAAIIDPTYNGHRNTSSSSGSTISPTYALPTPPQELMNEDAPCYMPIQGQRRNQPQSPSTAHEEKHKRRVKDGCKHQ